MSTSGRMTGMEWHENPLGFVAVRLHYSAQPDRDVNSPDNRLQEKAREWVETQRRSWPDPNDWEREMEINFFVSKGTRVFPQYTDTYHTVPLKFDWRRVVYRAWDYGWHQPFVLFAQVGPRDRLHVLRELTRSQMGTRTFATEVVRYSSQWFPNHTAGFVDFCDPAGQQVQTMESERSERRDVEVLQGLGINPTFEYGWSRKDGRSLVHQLLALRTDNTPGLLVDATGCPLLHQAFLGRYVYPETRTGKIHEDPDDMTHPWADVMACMRYLATGLHGKLGLRRLSAQEPAIAPLAQGFTGYGTLRKR